MLIPPNLNQMFLCHKAFKIKIAYKNLTLNNKLTKGQINESKSSGIRYL